MQRQFPAPATRVGIRRPMILPGRVNHMIQRIATLIVLAAALIAAAPKNRDWQTGMVLDPQDNLYFGHTYSHPTDATMSFGDARTGSQIHVGTRSPGDDFVLDQYVVESESYVYLAQTMRLRSNKPFRLPANMPVKFAIDKKRIWLLDAEGNEYQANIAKRKEKLRPTQ